MAPRALDWRAYDVCETVFGLPETRLLILRAAMSGSTIAVLFRWRRMSLTCRSWEAALRETPEILRRTLAHLHRENYLTYRHLEGAFAGFLESAFKKAFPPRNAAAVCKALTAGNFGELLESSGGWSVVRCAQTMLLHVHMSCL